jgi:predicted  nucleic acid-binding Zn-ribbon protein
MKESCAMRAFLQEWSSLIAALLVVVSIVYTSSAIQTHTGGVNDRLTTLEKNIESIRNAIEGNQGIAVRMATLDLHVNERLQNLIAQRDSAIERDEQNVFNTQDAFQTLKSSVDTIFTMTQRIESLEEMLLDMQASIESLKKQQNKENQ